MVHAHWENQFRSEVRECGSLLFCLISRAGELRDERNHSLVARKEPLKRTSAKDEDVNTAIKPVAEPAIARNARIFLMNALRWLESKLHPKRRDLSLVASGAVTLVPGVAERIICAPRTDILFALYSAPIFSPWGRRI